MSTSQQLSGVGGSYIEDHLTRMHTDIEKTTKRLEIEQRRLHKIDTEISNINHELEERRKAARAARRAMMTGEKPATGSGSRTGKQSKAAQVLISNLFIQTFFRERSKSSMPFRFQKQFLSIIFPFSS